MLRTRGQRVELGLRDSSSLQTQFSPALSQLTGDGWRPSFGRVWSSEAGKSFGGVGAEENKNEVGRSKELGWLSVSAVGQYATGVGRWCAVADRHRVETRRILHCRLYVKVLKRQQHLLQCTFEHHGKRI